MGISDNVGSALISSAGSLLGAGLGFISQHQANKANKELIQQQNQFNREERELTQQWNLEQWNRENAYNSPLEQRKRLEAAGFNPYNMNIETGSASSLRSTPQSASNTIAQQAYDPSHPVTAAFNQVSDQLYRQEHMNAMVNHENKQAVVAEELADYYISQQELAGSQRMLVDQDYLFKINNYDDLVKSLKNQNKVSEENANLLAAERTLTLLNADKQRILNDFLEPQMQLELTKTYIEIENLEKEGLVLEETAKELRSRAVRNYAEAGYFKSGTKLNDKEYELLERTLESAVKAINNENELKSAVASHEKGVVEATSGDKTEAEKSKAEGEKKSAKIAAKFSTVNELIKNGKGIYDNVLDIVLSPAERSATIVKNVGEGIGMAKGAVNKTTHEETYRKDVESKVKSRDQDTKRKNEEHQVKQRVRKARGY